MNAQKGETLGPLFEAPYVRHSETSRAAAEAIKPTISTLRGLVYHYIKHKGKEGATDEEVQEFYHLSGSSERPRRRELEQAGLVVDSGRTRATRSGRQATIWKTAL